MSQTATVSEPTRHEADRAASTFPQTLEQFEAQCLADAPPPRQHDPEPAAPEGAFWRLPRTAPHIRGLAHDNGKTAIVPKHGYLKISLASETVASGTHLVADRRRSMAESLLADSHARVLGSAEYASASGILPQHADAERNLRAATERLDSAEKKRAKLVAHPKSGLGKALIEVDGEVAAARTEVAEFRAEVAALTPAAQVAHAALVDAASKLCREAGFAMHAATEDRLNQLVTSFFAAHSDELTEIAVTSATRSDSSPSNHASLVRLIEADLVAPRDE